ncbi:MAG: hypothetical protein LUE10_02870, partial [Alistipes sp.]|nr:hypothetical protein [Alistipes sp.]
MKNKLFLRLAIFLAAILVFNSCRSMQEDLMIPPNGKGIDPDHLGIIAALGFDTESVTEFEGYYLVEGDIAFDKDDMPEYGRLAPSTRQYRYKTVLNNEKASNITVQLDPSVYAHDLG